MRGKYGVGLIVAGLNHAMQHGPGDPHGKIKKWFTSKMKEASSLLNDLTNWGSNVGTAAGMTSDWATGTGNKETYFIGGNVAEAMRGSSGITKARNDYYATGKNSGLAVFGLSGLVNSGLNPIQQFVGSYRYSIVPVGSQLFFSLTNTTSFSSAAYHVWPSSWNWHSGPMGNTKQTYIFSEPKR